MGHDQCVATTLREHNDLKDSAKHIQPQIDLKDSAKHIQPQIMCRNLADAKDQLSVGKHVHITCARSHNVRSEG